LCEHFIISTSVNVSSLISLSLANCGLRGQFPTNIFLMPKLSKIDLSYNHLLIGFLLEFHSGSSLELLDLSSTNFFGILPNSIDNLESFIKLDLSQAKLSWEIPNSIGNLQSLNFLDLSSNLSNNPFHGEIPFSLGNLTQLEFLFLFNSSFDGSTLKLQNISSSQLNYLDLMINKLYGSIPRSITNFTYLQYLYLSSINPKDMLRSCNLLEFPIFLKSLNELQYLDLSNNKIESKVPKWFWNVGKETLQSLNLSFNHFSGSEQPLNILPWKNMRYLNLRSNMLQGLLPTPPLSIDYFLASNNNLTGRIPPMICILNAFQVLDLSNNQLIGQIPHCLVMGYASGLDWLLDMSSSQGGQIIGLEELLE
ncbi:receptor-like protein 7, partial [Quercus suber]